MKSRFLKPTKVTWAVFAVFTVILILGASDRAAFLDEANDRQINSFYSSLPDFMKNSPLWEIWTHTIFPIVIMLAGNIWFYGISPEPAMFAREVFFITFNLVYYYIISSSVSFVINKKKHHDEVVWERENESRNNKALLIASVAYPAFLLLTGVYGFLFVTTDVGYAPNPQETFFFQLTTLGSMSAIVFFAVVGMVYWAKNKNPKKSITAIPFVMLLIVLLSLMSGILPRGANA